MFRRKIIILLFVIFFIEKITIYAKNPEWITNPNKIYSRDIYEFGIGEGKEEKEAENNAFSSLAKVFGMSVKNDTKAQQRFVKNAQGVEDTAVLEDNITVEAQHDLINVRIVERYYDSKRKKYYALAVMNKKETVPLIEKRIKENIDTIKIYLKKSEIEKDPLHKYSLVDLAYVVSLKNDSFQQQLMILDSSRKVEIEDAYRSNSLESMRNDIIQSMTFAVENSELFSSVQLVIEQMLSDFGLKISKNNPTYIFKENISYNGNDTGYGLYVLNYTLLIELVDTNNKRLTSFTFKGKEVGANEDAAKKVVAGKLSKSIKDSLTEEFGNFLNTMIE